MSENPDEPQPLLELLKRGVEQCAKNLGRLSYSTWNVDSVTLSSGTSGALDSLMETAGDDEHFGTFLSIPDGGFLVVFPQKSGYLVSNRFTLSGADPVDALSNRESMVLAEVSNIIINSIVTVLANACGRTLRISAPVPLKGSKKKILHDSRERFTTAGKSVWSCCVRLVTPTFSSDCDLISFLDAPLFETLSSGVDASEEKSS